MSTLRLRPLRPGDEEVAVRWAKDEAFCRANDWELGMTDERVRRHWQETIHSPPPGLLQLGIEEGGRLIGYVDLAGLTAESGEFGIAIGESGRWGQGLGAKSGRLLLAYAFGELHLSTVTAEVHAPNERSRRLMHHLGFEELGEVGQEEYQGEQVALLGYVLRSEAWEAAAL